MKISISRDGVEIGEWPQEQVKSLYDSGQLAGTDFYWHEGMTEWKELRSLIKPPIPKAPSQLPPDTTPRDPLSGQREVRPTTKIGRIAFLCWMLGWGVLSVGGVSLFNYFSATDPSAVNTLSTQELLKIFVVILPSCIACLLILAFRLRSMGYPGWYSLIGLLPLFGQLLILVCLFMPPREKVKIKAWQTTCMAMLAAVGVLFIFGYLYGLALNQP